MMNRRVVTSSTRILKSDVGCPLRDTFKGPSANSCMKNNNASCISKFLTFEDQESRGTTETHVNLQFQRQEKISGNLSIDLALGFLFFSPFLSHQTPWVFISKTLFKESKYLLRLN